MGHHRATAFWVTIHEVGHGLAFRTPAMVTKFAAELAKDGGSPVTGYGAAKPGESFPEGLALF